MLASVTRSAQEESATVRLSGDSARPAAGTRPMSRSGSATTVARTRACAASSTADSPAPVSAARSSSARVSGAGSTSRCSADPCSSLPGMVHLGILVYVC
ncbi:hypothetical protein STENM327S_08621 [Streptomyces tendae]